jgi:predicted ATPase
MGEEFQNRRGNSPTWLPSFVGRAGELQEIADLLSTERLVTLTGVGGVGKTRTALQLADQVSDRFPDGVWVVRLGLLRDGALLPHLICRETRLRDQTTRPMIEVLTEHLADSECLLVLDGCEHLLESCALLITVLLAVAPDVRIIATSRQPLNLRNEARYPLEPMPVHDEAALLFAERARRVDPEFALTETTSPGVERVCTRLEGIPLAVELAAALLADMPLDELAARVDDRFDMPPKGLPTLSAHHVTLGTAIGWSHELCSPQERLLWARLSVFAGGFTAQTAQEVCAGAPLAAEDIAPTLTGLVEKSLVSVRDGRYTLLDTISEFGAYWLRELGEEREFRVRHRDHYLAEARRAFDRWFTSEQAEWAERFTWNYADLRVALETCFNEPGSTALELLGALWFFWYCCGHQREGRLYFERALDQDSTPGYLRMRAAWSYGLIVLAQGDVEATDRAIEMCLAAAPEADRAPGGVAQRAAAYLKGTSCSIRGEADRAMRLVEPYDTPLDVTGMMEATSLMIQACVSYVHIVRGDLRAALKLAEWIRGEGARRGEFKYRSWGEYIWALAELGLGNPSVAVEHALQALEANRRLGDYWGMALVLDVLANGLAALGQGEQAARALGSGERMWQATFGRSQLGSPELAAARSACEQRIRGLVGDAVYEEAFKDGLETSLVQARVDP